jgi:hypothetical protein
MPNFYILQNRNVIVVNIFQWGWSCATYINLLWYSAKVLIFSGYSDAGEA